MTLGYFVNRVKYKVDGTPKKVEPSLTSGAWVVATTITHNVNTQEHKLYINIYNILYPALVS